MRMACHRGPFAQGILVGLLLGVMLACGRLRAQAPANGEHWVVSWAASAHGPYPSGNPSAQPDLSAAFPVPADGGVDQTFRAIIRPDLWGSRMRFRFSNAFGTRPVTLDGVFAGLQQSAAAVVAGTNRPVLFGGQPHVTIPTGGFVMSDAVDLPFATDAALPLLEGRSLAVSFHAAGATGPMTWHAKALTTSYISGPRTGSHGADVADAAFPFSTTSWFFLDAVDVRAPAGTAAIVCLGDSITDGTNSTLNGHDRWPDVLSRRLHAAYGRRVSVVNAGIGGNRIIGPARYTPAEPFAGGPSALDRLDRDVLALSGVSRVIWHEGINDISSGATAEAIIAGLEAGVRRLKAQGLRVIGTTIVSSVGATSQGATPGGDARRRAVNAFVRSTSLFDGLADFDTATVDAATGALKPEFVPNSTVGGAGDHLHPNRAGYQAMGAAIDLELLMRADPAR
jgi:lysophospholipase L1-like esterase